MQRDLAGTLCGIAGPTAFVGAWVVGGLVTDGYDPLQDAISRLAAEGAPTRPLMTAGLVAFGVLVPVWARVLGERLDSAPLRRVVTVAGLATLAVAALPLTREGGTTQDALHAVAAGTGYLAMAATPLVAAPLLRRRGRTRAAAVSVAVGVLSAACLVGTLVVGEDGALGSGGLQRLGLTVVDAWHVVAAVAVLRGGLRRR
ncbi:MAG TPA: DUF998 domain-containing protein [Mycobacteriales bacterium]|nr:DUF998 domain-containing protein [Mycobacteriales bacterium]